MHNICREPYRLFFPLGIVAGTIGIGHWVLYAMGWTANYSGFFHSSIQIMVYMNCFIIGFLMTSLPRFTQTFPSRWWEVVTSLILFIGMVVLLAVSQWILAEFVLLGWYVFLMYFALCRIVKRSQSDSKAKPPIELVWIPIGLLHGIVGILILMLGQTELWPAWAIKVGKPMMDQGFLVCLVVGVGGFLIPRLMGTYSSQLSIRVGYYLACAGLFFVSFFVEGLGWPNIGYGLRAAAITAAFLKTSVLTRFPKPGSAFYVWLAWTSVWMVLFGFWGAALLSQYQVLMLHITFIGGFSLMTFAVASMVILSHAGEGQRLNSGIWILPAVAIGIFLTLINRLIVAFLPDLYFQLLGWSSVIWMIAAWAWFMFMLPHLFFVPKEDEFARMHDQAKSKQCLQ